MKWYKVFYTVLPICRGGHPLLY